MVFTEGSAEKDISEGYIGQLGLLTTSVSRHEETLRSLKGVPTILQNMATKMGVSLDQTDIQSECGSYIEQSGSKDNEGSPDDFIQQMINQTNQEDDNNGLDEELMEALKDCEKGMEMGPEVIKSVADAYNRTGKRPLSKDTIAGLTEQKLKFHPIAKI